MKAAALDIYVFCFIGEKNDEWMRSTATVMAPLCTMAGGKEERVCLKK